MRSHLLSLALAALGAPSIASAQAIPPPPAGYTAIQVSLDEVLMPLLVAAEQDLAQGRPGLAIARAQIVLEATAPDSTFRVRAEGARLVAQQRLAGSEPEAPAVEALLEPLVASAEIDSQRRQHAIAIARLDFVLSRLPPESTLARRAQALRQAAAQLLASAPPQPAPSPATASPYGGYGVPAPAPAYGSASVGLAPGYGLAEPSEIPPRPSPPADPTLRGTGELVELVVTAALYGAYLGFFIPFAADDEFPSPAYPVTMLVGGGVLALAVAALDSGEGLRTGVGPSISVGLRYGMAAGMLFWGALDDEFDPTWMHGGMIERTAMPVALGAGGALLGAIVGYGMQPDVQQVRFVETSGIWGAALGLYVAMLAAEDSTQGFAITAGGLGLTLATTAVMASAGAYPSVRRAWLLTLGFTIGTGIAGLTTSLLYSAEIIPSQDTDAVFGGTAIATSLTGLLILALLTDGMDPPRETDPPPVTISVAPVAQGNGAIGTVAGTF